MCFLDLVYCVFPEILLFASHMYLAGFTVGGIRGGGGGGEFSGVIDSSSVTQVGPPCLAIKK